MGGGCWYGRGAVDQWLGCPNSSVVIALEALLSSDDISAEQAEDWGYVNRAPSGR